MSSKIFMAKNEVTFKGKSPFIILDYFEVDASMKILKLESHFHAPSALMGKPKPVGPEAVAKKFGQGLLNHGKDQVLLNLFVADGSWTDPVPTPPHVGTAKLKARIAKLPPMENVSVKEVFYSMSPKIFLAKTEVTFKGKSPFTVVDRFELA